jgi:hypothetical protein
MHERQLTIQASGSKYYRQIETLQKIMRNSDGRCRYPTTTTDSQQLLPLAIQLKAEES